MTSAREVAALIRQSLAEQDAEDSLWGGYVRHAVNADGTPDLTDVTIDGHYNLIDLAEAIITEVKSGVQPQQYIPDEDLRDFPGQPPKFPDDTFVESADGSVWRVEPDFGWDCVSSGSASLMGPARLLVLGGQE